MNDRFDTAGWTPTAILAGIAGLCFAAGRRLLTTVDDSHDCYDPEDDE